MKNRFYVTSRRHIPDRSFRLPSIAYSREGFSLAGAMIAMAIMAVAALGISTMGLNLVKYQNRADIRAERNRVINTVEYSILHSKICYYALGRRWDRAGTEENPTTPFSSNAKTLYDYTADENNPSSSMNDPNDPNYDYRLIGTDVEVWNTRTAVRDASGARQDPTEVLMAGDSGCSGSTCTDYGTNIVKGLRVTRVRLMPYEQWEEAPGLTIDPDAARLILTNLEVWLKVQSSRRQTGALNDGEIMRFEVPVWLTIAGKTYNATGGQTATTTDDPFMENVTDRFEIMKCYSNPAAELAYNRGGGGGPPIIPQGGAQGQHMHTQFSNVNDTRVHNHGSPLSPDDAYPMTCMYRSGGGSAPDSENCNHNQTSGWACYFDPATGASGGWKIVKRNDVTNVKRVCDAGMVMALRDPQVVRSGRQMTGLQVVSNRMVDITDAVDISNPLQIPTDDSQPNWPAGTTSSLSDFSFLQNDREVFDNVMTCYSEEHNPLNGSECTQAFRTNSVSGGASQMIVPSYQRASNNSSQSNGFTQGTTPTANEFVSNCRTSNNGSCDCNNGSGCMDRDYTVFEQGSCVLVPKFSSGSSGAPEYVWARIKNRVNREHYVSGGQWRDDVKDWSRTKYNGRFEVCKWGVDIRRF